MHLIASEPLHILLVEQDADILDLFTTLFSSKGYTVATARCAGEALDAVNARAPDAVFSSLVFSDMNGFDLCARLRSMPETADSRIVALTGYSAPGIEDEVSRAGFDQYLLKPVQVQVMLDLLDELATAKAGRPYGRKRPARRAGLPPPGHDTHVAGGLY